MRYVRTQNLKIGDLNGKDIFSYNNSLLLAKGEPLSLKKIKRLEELGYGGIYITDSFSEDLEIHDVVSDNLRMCATNNVKSLFEEAIFNKPRNEGRAISNIKQLVNDMVQDILENKNVVIDLINLKQYDDYTFSHSVNVAILSIVMGTSMKLNQFMLNELGVAAMLHDIGKIFTDKDILNKNGKLTNDEYEQIKKHSDYGWIYVKRNNAFSEQIEKAVLMHHERFDGTGYPHGACKDEIPVFAKIISLADVYDAMTSDRPYRTRCLPSEAMEYIMGGSSTLFDPQIVKSFVGKVAPYPTGTVVVLSNGARGIVVENHAATSIRPKIRIIDGEQLTDEYCDLSSVDENLNITIKEVVY
ncbi:MAG: metal dependent phosphohydrolase [Oscillospiraceae bacterium]|jgi:HD-GYP domain-containing protein (c-di-GMP phosphodiesterase class II)|nr:metal dependent phosphohydrolase [Oscillospiraceae bacterium]